MKKYSARVDGFTITEVEISDKECSTQAARDKIRSKIAAHYMIPRHYIKLVRSNTKYIERYDQKTGKTVRVYE